MNVLVVNAGSSSLKLRLLGADDTVLAAADGTPDEVTEAVDRIIGDATVDAVGHRVVHGGTRYTAPVRIDAQVREGLGDLVELAPLHQPAALRGIDAVTGALPDVPTVACFDTAFHADLPAAAATYAVPWDVRRYGFHGLSYAYAAPRVAELLDRPVGELRTVICHLGAGASACAVAGGRSVATTMGFTPLEGLVMATRSGDVDPGLLLWLLRQRGMSADELADTLEHRSGLAALAGTPDMAAVVERAGADDERASLALDVYTHRLRATIASLTASLGGLDALVFTGGVGEHAPVVRASAVAGLAYLGLAIDDGLNAAAGGDAVISALGAPAEVVVIAAREDVTIAREVRAVLGR